MALISIVLPDLRPGGAERNCLILAQELLLAGNDVDIVLLRKEGTLLSDLPEGIRLYNLGVRRIRHVPRPLARYIDSRRPHAVIANMWPVTTASVLARMLTAYRWKLMVVDHSILSHAYQGYGSLHRIALRASIATLYRFADARVGVSQGVVDDLADLSGMPAGRFEVVYNPLRKFRPSTESEKRAADKYWMGHAGYRILTVGTLKPVKNHALLIRAFATMRSPENAKLMILGEGRLRASLEELAEKEGVTDKVIFPGYFPDPLPFYESADVFVLSSDHEGFGNVIIEALSCGVPVVSTDCPSGPTEILQGGKYGTLVPVRDEKRLATAMSQALLGEHNTDLLRNRARDFSAKKNMETILSLLGI
jgi:glycosyltransferase involved in cell wall biosynthesis